MYINWDLLNAIALMILIVVLGAVFLLIICEHKKGDS